MADRKRVYQGRPGLADWGEDLGELDPRVLRATRAGVKANVMPTSSTSVPFAGLLESTSSLPALPYFLGDLLTGGKYELSSKAPQFAVEASENYDQLVNKYLAGESLPESSRLSGPEQFGLAAGEMLGQLPIPGKLLEKVTNVLPAALKPAGWLAEYFGPTVDPKVSNYAIGTGVGGALRTSTSAGGTEEIEPGNVDTSKLPVVRNPDGSVSTVHSIGVEMDGRHYLIPTVVDGRMVSSDEAIEHFKRTGRHLGAYKSREASDAAGRQLSKQEASRVGVQRYARGGLRRAPIRATAEGVVETLPPKLEGTQIRKDPGGNWMPGSVERIVDDARKALVVAGGTPADRLRQLDEWLQTDPQFEAAIRERARVQADNSVDQWLQTKLTNYIKNDMATERDPVRKGIEQRVAKADEAYTRGSERIAKSQRKIAEAKASGKNTTTAEDRLAQEITDLKQKYELDRIGAASPVARYGESYNPYRQGAYAERQRSQSPALAVTPESVAWEDMTDASVAMGEAIHVRNRPFLPKAYAEELSRIPYNAQVYELRNTSGFNNVLAHMRDELLNSVRTNSDLPPELRLKPEDLEKMNMDAAVGHIGKVDAWRERNRIAADLLRSRNAATVTFKEYPGTGLEWKQLKMPEPDLTGLAVEHMPEVDMWRIQNPEGHTLSSGATEREAKSLFQREERTKLLEDALNYEGSVMGHCVGGYCPPVASGKTQIFSLRDAKGEPHVTIEVRPHDVNEAIRKLPDDELNTLALQVLDQHFGGRMPNTLDKFYELRNQAYVEKYGEPLPSIIQVKGKGNQRPADKYIPFVQDFVKSREWAGVNDLENTDLRMPAELTRTDLLNLGINEPDFQKAFGERAYQYLTKEEIEEIVRSHKSPKQLGDGGAVEYDKSEIEKMADDLYHKMVGIPRKVKQAAANVTDIGGIIKRSNEIPLKYFDEKTEMDGAADAMRHILFQGQLTRKYGEGPAKTISYMHEYTSPGQAAEAREMDLYNDEIGRELGRVAKSDDELIDLAQKYVRSGKAKTLSGSRGGY